MPNVFRPVAAVSLCAALAAAPTLARASSTDVPGIAGAVPVSGVTEAPRPAFYEPPTSLPRRPGTLIRSESLDPATNPFGLSAELYDQRRVMYSSTDRQGRPMAVTGLVISPKAGSRHRGGQRPLIVNAPGTRGSADRCAASRAIQPFAPYEAQFIRTALERGAVVAIPDYQGLGTPGTHTYTIREAQAHAVLDLARATRGLRVGVGHHSAVGLNGYSQGGGAVAAAAELAPRYAPELAVKGVAVGAPPADLAKVGANIDGSPYSGLVLFTAAALFSAYDIDPTTMLNPGGLAALQVAESSCSPDLARLAMTPSTAWTASGESFPALYDREPLKSAIADNRIGRLRPKAPVLITHSRQDELVPFAAGEQLARDWCARKARVTFVPTPEGAHGVAGAAHESAAASWLTQRLAGVRAPRGCSGL